MHHAAGLGRLALRRRAQGAAAVFGLVAGLLGGSATAADWRVNVRGGGADLGETPIVAEVKGNLPAGAYRLQAPCAGEPVAAQVFTDGGKTYLAAVLGRVDAKTTTPFTLTPDASGRPSEGVEVRKAGVNLDVLVGGKPWTTYIADEPSKPYFYPVFGPTGDEVTRAYPMKQVEGEDRDHNHQRSFWFTYGNINGHDYWASDPLNKPSPKLPFGTIRETSRSVVAGGPAVGVLRTTDDWLGPDGKKELEDVRVVRFYATKGARVLDADVTLKATAGPVTFNDTKEGMFGFRVASSMDVNKKKGGKITNAEGITDVQAWGKASPWVDYVGPVNGKTLGIAILNHPDSFRYPTTWHVRDYGLFAANPFGWHDFGVGKSGEYTLPAGQSLNFRYRVIFHEGDTASSKIADAFKGYAEPPTVEVVAD